MTVVIVAIDPYMSKSTLDVNEFLCKTLKYAYSGNWDEPNPRYMGVPRTFCPKISLTRCLCQLTGLVRRRSWLCSMTFSGMILLIWKYADWNPACTGFKPIEIRMNAVYYFLSLVNAINNFLCQVYKHYRYATLFILFIFQYQIPFLADDMVGSSVIILYTVDRCYWFQLQLVNFCCYYGWYLLLSLCREQMMILLIYPMESACGNLPRKNMIPYGSKVVGIATWKLTLSTSSTYESS